MVWLTVDRGLHSRTITPSHRPRRVLQLMRSITSRQHPVVTRFRALADTVDTTGARVLLDGVHLVREAQESGSTFEIVAVSSSRVASDSEEAHVAEALSNAGIEVVQAADAVFD